MILLHRKAYHSSYDQIIQRSRQSPRKRSKHIIAPHTFPGLDLRQIGHADAGSLGELLLSQPAIVAPSQRLPTTVRSPGMLLAMA